MANFPLLLRQKGALLAATKTFQAGESKAPGSALEGLLQGLAGVAQQASEDLGQGVEEAKLIAHAVKVNVFHSCSSLSHCATQIDAAQ